MPPDILALTETWTKPENKATPAALSTNHSFSHTSRTSGKGGGTGMLISNKWKYNQLLPNANAKYNTFEYHAILVTAPVKIYIVVVYRPPGQLGDFVDELDILLSSITEHDCPIIVLGDMNIHLDSPNSSDFLRLMHSFELQLVCSPPTHKTGKELDLIFTRNCATEALCTFYSVQMESPKKTLCFYPYGFLPPQPVTHPLLLPPADLTKFQALLSSFSSSVTDAKKVFLHQQEFTELPTAEPSLNMSATKSACRSPTASFTPLTESSVSKLLTCSRPTTCPLNPNPTNLC